MTNSQNTEDIDRSKYKVGRKVFIPFDKEENNPYAPGYGVIIEVGGTIFKAKMFKAKMNLYYNEGNRKQVWKNIEAGYTIWKNVSLSPEQLCLN